jgi:hypothetical protein
MPAPAFLAKKVVRHLIVSLVIREFKIAGSKAESLGLCLHRPKVHLRAYGAIAFPGAGTDVQIRFEPNSAAMTASTIGFYHHV